MARITSDVDVFIHRRSEKTIDRPNVLSSRVCGQSHLYSISDQRNTYENSSMLSKGIIGENLRPNLVSFPIDPISWAASKHKSEKD